MFSKDEISRYSRHFTLPEIGMEGQQKLKSANALVIGAGGLGCPVLQYLTASGVGVIGICDGDAVNVSNLQRQVLYTVGDVGNSKALAAKAFLEKQNTHVKFDVYEKFLDQKNALEIISQYDLIIDCSDNFETRYLINDACVIAGKPFVFGSILSFEGQVSVFNYNNGPTYRCLYPEAPEDAPNCSGAGVLGVLPGIIGTMQANEALKIIIGIGEVLAGKLLIFNTLSMQFQFLEFEKNHDLIINDILTETLACNVEAPGEIDYESLKIRISKGEKINLIDLRERYEKDNEVIGSVSIPFGEILERFSELDRNVTTVLFCIGGNRSKVARNKLREIYSSTHFLSLKEGAKAFN
ncbi:MAG: molybdopterin-synthase adenylyltransferase MoeB [Bacteroidetes bacterium]|nr:molybdopterin-synthase adenylyltransferase MoeB [Bacteroidota bacterium]